MPRKQVESYRIMGVDPGIGRTGIAILERTKDGEHLIFSECFETEFKETHPIRLSLLTQHIAEILATHTPQELAIEKLYFSKNKKTALAVAEARGTILSEAATRGLLIFEYHPSEIKLAVTGHGGSDKSQVKYMVTQLLKLKKKIALDDEYDAIAVGLTHLATQRGV